MAPVSFHERYIKLDGVKGNIIRRNYSHPDRGMPERVMDDSDECLEEYGKRRQVGHFTGFYFLRQPSVTGATELPIPTKNSPGRFYNTSNTSVWILGHCCRC